VYAPYALPAAEHGLTEKQIIASSTRQSSVGSCRRCQQFAPSGVSYGKGYPSTPSFYHRFGRFEVPYGSSSRRIAQVWFAIAPLEPMTEIRFPDGYAFPARPLHFLPARSATGEDLEALPKKIN
jgi:hypothetical protein